MYTDYSLLNQVSWPNRNQSQQGEAQLDPSAKFCAQEAPGEDAARKKVVEETKLSNWFGVPKLLLSLEKEIFLDVQSAQEWTRIEDLNSMIVSVSCKL